MEGGYIRNQMKSKLPKLPNESHKNYMRRCTEAGKQRIQAKYANRRQTLKYFESVRKGEIEYRRPTNPVPSKTSKGRTLKLKPKYGVPKYDI